MMFPEHIQWFDEHVFHLINQSWSNHFFDLILPPIRDRLFWVPLYMLIAIFLIWKYKKQGIFFILLLGANFAVSDQLSSAVIKPWIHRDRPCNNIRLKDSVILRVDRCGAGKSFTSSHATNTFAFAMLLTLLFRKKNKWIMPLSFLWAFSISYAQVYVGVHYPLDVAGGMVLGILISLVIFFMAKKLFFRRIDWEY